MNKNDKRSNQKDDAEQWLKKRWNVAVVLIYLRILFFFTGGTAVEYWVMVLLIFLLAWQIAANKTEE